MTSNPLMNDAGGRRSIGPRAQTVRRLTIGLPLVLFSVAACSGSDDPADPMAPDPDPNPTTSVFEVRGDADFTIRNAGATSYLFSWTDASGTYTDVEDPTLILEVGGSYTFQRASGAHPFRITTDALPVTGTDGAFRRTTSDPAVIDGASLTPIADFTADPAPTSDLIAWSPTASEVGDYFYTCTVTSHTGMTGAIQVR